MSPTKATSDLSRLRIARIAPPSQARKRRMLLLWVSVAALVVGTAVGIAAMIKRAVPEVQTVRPQPIRSIEPGTALTASGYIVPHHKVDVNSKITGRVKWVGVEKGDHVKGGQILVELEDDEFRSKVQQAQGQVEAARAYLGELEAGSLPQQIEQARNNLQEAEATVRDDQVTLYRTRILAQDGIVARQQLDDAQARYDSDGQKAASLSQTYALTREGPRQEEIERARGSLIEAEGELAYAEAQLAATKIRAPLAGTILERSAEVGELVTSTFASTAVGGPLGSVVSLADLRDLQVELDIAQDDFSKLHPHQRGVVTTDAYPDRKYNCILAEVSPEANRQKATVQVRVQILNPDDYLRPDMNALVEFLPERRTAVRRAPIFLVPANSLRREGDRFYVLLDYKDRAVACYVRLVNRRPNGVLVQGLHGGEELIINAPADVTDGSRIR